METLRRIWKVKEVRNSLLFIIVMLIIFRMGAHVPVPGVDSNALKSIFDGNQFFGLLNIFSGGTLDNFSILALGVAPYITSSIIFQLLAMIIPKFEEMQKEEAGRQKINQWTRMAVIPLAALQSFALIALLGQQGGSLNIFSNPSSLTLALAVTSMVAGTIFLMWLGELISEKNIGNGISILILAGIIAGLPTFLGQAISIYDRTQLVTAILFLIATLITVVSIVIMNEAQRNVPVQYSRQVRGSRSTGGVSSHIPLRLNMGGVIPIIFAISIILFPSIIGQFFVNAKSSWIQEAAQWTLEMFQNQTFYGVVYFLLVFGFAYFYTAVIFHPDQVAENLQKQGGFIPGIRPGRPTAEYLDFVSNRILFTGATFLSLVAVLPLIVQVFTGNSNLVIGGTSILIIVAVVIDSIKQIEAQLTMRQYDM
jgi:preprotein translocase subunit SecY